MQTTLSKTHVGIFVFTICASAGYKEINMKKKMALTMLREAVLLAFYEQEKKKDKI